MWTVCICLGFGFLLGVFVTMLSTIAHDKIRRKRMKERVCAPESWCSRNCERYNDAFVGHDDPKEAIKVVEVFCNRCPIADAQQIIFEEEQCSAK